MATRRLTLSLVLLGAATGAWPQVSERVVITERAVPSVGGFGPLPALDSPMQASAFGTETLAEAGAGLGAMTHLAAGVGDAYSSVGYWTAFQVRGFVLDLRHNVRRDGLPINAETALALENKERVELLEGTSGVQAGVSSPGGLINLVVKRPHARVRQAHIGWRQDGGLAAAVDWSDRLGAEGRLGLRINAAAAALRPQLRDADGSRRLAAIAADWIPGADTRLEAEIESHRQRQPSQPGFSLRGDTLPDAGRIDPRTNLNNQPWSQPVVFDGTTASVRWRQRLTPDWSLVAQAMMQRLRTDDRVAFPFGCTDGEAYLADRYCADGDRGRFDLYDYRSEGERRRSDVADVSATGRLVAGSWTHDLQAGVQATRTRDTLPPLAFNPVGQGYDDGSAMLPPDPTRVGEPFVRRERSTEAYVRDAIRLGNGHSLWAGLRHTRLARDGRQSFTSPWVGVSLRVARGTNAYASWGRGVESETAPALPVYANAGELLPALRSRQLEVGLKHDGDAADWSVAAFDIVRPQSGDREVCDTGDTCRTVRAIDGQARHRGIEAALQARLGPVEVDGSALWLDATRRGAADPAINGLRPTNVPRHAVKSRFTYDMVHWPGLQWQAAIVHEGPRMVLPDNSVRAPGWTRIDLAARWRLRAEDVDWTARVGIDNVADRRAWRETPYQFGHVYLFPLAGRSLHASLTATF